MQIQHLAFCLHVIDESNFTLYRVKNNLSDKILLTFSDESSDLERLKQILRSIIVANSIAELQNVL
ncbi:hypothetical protein IQ243_05400 [Nostocales cyanobacterium LEGE 11386]|nr:hypothetical protein [Nostocales cyanobacterium LEGE 11386]